MVEIIDPRVTKEDDKYVATCQCGSIMKFSDKNGALKMLERGTCRNCKKDYRSKNIEGLSVYKNSNGKWCSTCSDCGTEQAYTRRNHAIESEKEDRQCKKCAQKAGKFDNNRPVGNKQRLFNRFKKSAISRNIVWDLTLEEMFKGFNGKCNLTGWSIDIDYLNSTASLDRIDSTKGYTVDNIQWVHSMVNMSKNKYDNSLFIEMCKAVAKIQTQ